VKGSPLLRQPERASVRLCSVCELGILTLTDCDQTPFEGRAIVIPGSAGGYLSLVSPIPTTDGNQNVICGRNVAAVECAIRIRKPVFLRARRGTHVRRVHRVRERRRVGDIPVARDLLASVRDLIANHCGNHPARCE
jgi:hypothetical protein